MTGRQTMGRASQRRQAMEEGLDLPGDVWEALEETAAECGLPPLAA